MNITVEEGPNYRRYVVRSSPNNNQIQFIKNKTLNTRTKRIYATAELNFRKAIPSSILDYMKTKGMKEEETAYLSYIGITKTPLRTRHRSSPNSVTVLYQMNNTINKKNRTSKAYYSKSNKMYTLSKGYGRRLLTEIEKRLKEEGIRYLVLLPSSNVLESYYAALQYESDHMEMENNPIEEEKSEKRMIRTLIMYKDLST
jgi:hypothetical protein